MDEQQFKDVIKVVEEHNKATLNCFMNGIKELVTALHPSQKDHDLLIEIKTLLSGCQSNCKVEKAVNKEHRDEAIQVRDTVKKLDRIVNGFCRFGWLIVGALIVTVQATVAWLFNRGQ